MENSQRDDRLQLLRRPAEHVCRFAPFSTATGCEAKLFLHMKHQLFKPAIWAKLVSHTLRFHFCAEEDMPPNSCQRFPESGMHLRRAWYWTHLYKNEQCSSSERCGRAQRNRTPQKRVVAPTGHCSIGETGYQTANSTRTCCYQAAWWHFLHYRQPQQVVLLPSVCCSAPGTNTC